MDLSVNLDDTGAVTVTAVNLHPVERQDAAAIMIELLTSIHRLLSRCGDDGA